MTGFCVYGLIDPRTDHLRYVGKTTVGVKRLEQHLRPSNLRLNTHVNHWMSCLVQIGLRPTFLVLEEHGDEQLLFEAEQFFIAYFRSLGCRLTNATAGGDGSRGCKPSVATRAKMSASRKGRSVSQATREKIRAALRGRVVPLEQKKRMSEGRQGLRLSDAHRAALADAMRGNSYGAGYKHSGEAREAISRSLLGNKRAAGQVRSAAVRARVSAALQGNQNARSRMFENEASALFGRE